MHSVACAITSGRSIESACRSSKNAVLIRTSCRSPIGELRRRRIANDLVVHIRDVHHVMQGEALLAQEPPQDINMEEGTEVADVPVVVDRRPAAIHPQLRRAHRRQRLNGAAQGVVEIECRHGASGAFVAGADALPLEVCCAVSSDSRRMGTALRSREAAFEGAVSNADCRGRLLTESKLRRGPEIIARKLACEELRPRRRGDHRGVVRRKRE